MNEANSNLQFSVSTNWCNICVFFMFLFNSWALLWVFCVSIWQSGCLAWSNISNIANTNRMEMLHSEQNIASPFKWRLYFDRLLSTSIWFLLHIHSTQHNFCYIRVDSIYSIIHPIQCDFIQIEIDNIQCRDAVARHSTVGGKEEVKVNGRSFYLTFIEISISISHFFKLFKWNSFFYSFL